MKIFLEFSQPLLGFFMAHESELSVSFHGVVRNMQAPWKFFENPMNLELKILHFSCTKDCTTVYSLQYTITVIHTLSLKLYTEELTYLWNFLVLLYKHTHMKDMTRSLDSLIVYFVSPAVHKYYFRIPKLW